MIYYTRINASQCYGCGCDKRMVKFVLEDETNIEAIDKFCSGEYSLDDLGGFIFDCVSLVCSYGGRARYVKPSQLSTYKDKAIASVSDELIVGISDLIKLNREKDRDLGTNDNIEKIFNYSFTNKEFDNEQVEKMFQVKGSKRDVDNLTFLLSMISKLSKEGSSRSIMLHVDGDGSFRVDIKRTDNETVKVPRGYGWYVPEECIKGELTDPIVTSNKSEYRAGIDMVIGI